jgi:hypothetical protein
MTDGSLQKDTLTGAFNQSGLSNSATAKPKGRPPKSTSVISIRVTPEERAKLEQDAAGESLSVYIRRCMLKTMRKAAVRRNAPSEDYQQLAQALGTLGTTNIFADARALLKASEGGTLCLQPETERALVDACGKVAVMRSVLMRALGFKAE